MEFSNMSIKLIATLYGTGPIDGQSDWTMTSLFLANFESNFLLGFIF